MPTILRKRPEIAVAAQRLSWRDTVRFVILLAQVRWLNRRLEAARCRVEHYGFDIAGPDLVIAARRWLDLHEAIAHLLGIPEPSHVAQVRVTIGHTR